MHQSLVITMKQRQNMVKQLFFQIFLMTQCYPIFISIVELLDAWFTVYNIKTLPILFIYLYLGSQTFITTLTPIII